nr:hypothetical protein [Mycoplasmopsis caviae]
MNYLYSEGKNIILMDNETYEQIEVPVSHVEWEMNFIKEGSTVKVRMYKDEILDIEIEDTVTLEVIEAPDAVKGNTTTTHKRK